jgi:hypothetical protein
MSEDPSFMSGEWEQLQQELRDAMLDGDESEIAQLKVKISKVKKDFNDNYNSEVE